MKGTMREIGFGVIGCSFISEFHIKSILNIEKANLIGVASRSKKRAKSIAKEANCIATTDYSELLAHPEIDVICVTSISGSHGRIGLEALEHGKHVLVEKPLAMTSEEANQMIEKANEKKLLLSVVSQRRFEPQHKVVKDTLTKKTLGEIVAVEVSCPFYRTQSYYDESPWRGTKSEDGGALMNQGIHSIDLMLWLIGSVKTVYGKKATKTHHIEAEDLAMATVTFENNAIGTIVSSTSFQPGFPPEINIYGEKGTIKLAGTEIVHWSVENVPEPYLQKSEFSGGGVADPTHIPSEFHQEQITDFMKSLTNDQLPLVIAEHGKETIQLIEAIHQSSNSGKEINLT